MVSQRKRVRRKTTSDNSKASGGAAFLSGCRDRGVISSGPHPVLHYWRHCIGHANLVSPFDCSRPKRLWCKGVATFIKLTFKPSFKPLEILATIIFFLNYLLTVFKLFQPSFKLVCTGISKKRTWFDELFEGRFEVVFIFFFL